MTLVLVVCLGNCQSEQWECQDGGCITLGSRCDSLPDCTDKSDEQNCTIGKISGCYRKSPINHLYQLKHAISLDVQGLH